MTGYSGVLPHHSHPHPPRESTETQGEDKMDQVRSQQARLRAFICWGLHTLTPSLQITNSAHNRPSAGLCVHHQTGQISVLRSQPPR